MRTRLTELLGCRHPIVQTGMGYVAGAELVAATSGAGGFGILASATMSLDQLGEAVREVRRRTDAPFGVNLRADAPDAAERVDLLVRERVRLASFALAPSRDLVRRCADGGVLTMPRSSARLRWIRAASSGRAGMATSSVSSAYGERTVRSCGLTRSTSEPRPARIGRNGNLFAAARSPQ